MMDRIRQVLVYCILIVIVTLVLTLIMIIIMNLIFINFNDLTRNYFIQISTLESCAFVDFADVRVTV